MDKLEVGDIVGYQGEIGIVLSLSPSPLSHHDGKLTASVKWMDGDQDITKECAYDPQGIYIIVRASGS